MIQSPAEVAENALELLRTTQERINQMRVLFSSIIKDMKHGKSLDIEELANLGCFLAQDWANYVDCEVEQMHKELGAASSAIIRPPIP